MRPAANRQASGRGQLAAGVRVSAEVQDYGDLHVQAQSVRPRRRGAWPRVRCRSARRPEHGSGTVSPSGRRGCDAQVFLRQAVASLRDYWLFVRLGDL